jgi:hypothetical protein
VGDYLDVFAALLKWDPPRVLACTVGDLDRMWMAFLYERSGA